MDYKEMYFKLYADFSELMERFKEIMQKYEDAYCDNSVREDNE